MKPFHHSIAISLEDSFSISSLSFADLEKAAWSNFEFTLKCFQCGLDKRAYFTMYETMNNISSDLM